MSKRSNNMGQSPAAELFRETEGWRKALWFREGRWVDDGVAEIAAIVWEQIASGVTDHREMYYASSRSLKRVARRQQRINRHPHVAVMSEPASPDFADRVCRVLDAENLATTIRVPAKAEAWVKRRVKDGDHISEAQRLAGSRWARREARRLGAAGHVA